MYRITSTFNGSTLTGYGSLADCHKTAKYAIGDTALRGHTVEVWDYTGRLVRRYSK